MIRRPAPGRYARYMLARRRSSTADLALGTLLAAVAGFVNAGGFFALGRYTSHMTGYLSELADMTAIGRIGPALLCLAAILAFVAGAATAAWMVDPSRRDRAPYARHLTVEGGLLLLFPLLALIAAPAALLLLCLVMGFQNATITKISGARVRTTHVTGMITDIGIDIGRALHDLTRPGRPPRLDRGHLWLQLRIVGAFVAGGVLGAGGFALIGHGFAVPAALLLLAVGVAGRSQASRSTI